MILRFLYRNCLSLALLFAAAGPAMAAGAQTGSLEISVKAAFLPKFAAYVNWPPNVMGASDDPLQLCVIGRDPFGPKLDEAASRQHIDQHPILVRRLEDTEDAAQCHIAFVGGSAKQSAEAMLTALQGQPILTVTDDRLGPQRGIVHFILKKGRVRFHIDDTLAARSNLNISAKLLSLAVSVKPRGRA